MSEKHLKNKADPYSWAKDKISSLYNSVNCWNHIEVTTQKHGVWSIKKLLALDYYISAFVKG
jgi:hypothetical protein